MAYKQLKLWFDGELATLLASKITSLGYCIDETSFIDQVESRIGPLELKDRVEVIADALYDILDEEFQSGIGVLVKILGPENPNQTGMFSEYYWVMPIAKYVEKYGLDHWELSMNAIFEITKRNTGEYCIRPFIVKYPDETIEKMIRWSLDSNFHVRRLASEGGRPRLPWARKLDLFIRDPSPLLPILENLKSDDVKYVQKSVANCIHDILKDRPDIGKSLVESWIPVRSPNTSWIVKHSLRSLVKKNDQWAHKVIRDLR